MNVGKDAINLNSDTDDPTGKLPIIVLDGNSH